MTPTVYKQVKLLKAREHQTAWIPSKYARKGLLVRIKKDEKWDCGWRVIEVFNLCLDEAVVFDRAHNHNIFPSLSKDI